jgi:phosphonate utilization transcriptional regulator
MSQKDPPHTALALLRSSSLASAVEQEIERAILRGELEPGAKLNEAHLAERLGVSRGPVREAFRMLQTAGLVRLEKNRGSFVRQVAPDEAMELYEVRAMIEESVGRALARAITPAQLKVMHSLLDTMGRAVKSGDAGAYHPLDLEFHDRLVEFSGNRKLTLMYRQLINELSLFRRFKPIDAKTLPLSTSEHDGILKAIASGNPERAGRAMREHVAQSRERILRRQAVAGDTGQSIARKV